MDHVGEVPDHTLWRRAAAGDGDAFGSLFERHAARIYNYCFRRTGDWARAEDLTSATFLVAWKTCLRGPLREESALPLLYGIATNVLRNQRRSLKRGRAAFARLPLPRIEEPDFADDTAERLDDSRAMKAVLTVFAQLPHREQDVIALCDWSDLSYEDTAAALQIPIGTVRSRLARGRRRLRELAGAVGPEKDVNVVPLPIEVNEQ
jgi:RNA polymerase sigma-70 factor (ECF subfamily)